MILLFIKLGMATPSSRILQNDIECQININGSYPKVEEIFEVIFRVRLKTDNDIKKLPEKTIAKGYIVFFGSERPKKSMEVVNNKEIFVPSLKLGEWHEFIGKFRIIKLVTQISFGAGIHLKEFAGSGTGRSITLFLVDSTVGQYGTKEEYEGNLPIEYRYDPVDWSFTCSPSQNPAPVDENRRIIKMIKQFEPALSDSEALLLHSDQYRVGLPEGLPMWNEENKRWMDEEIFEYYLKDGWFKALREGRHEKWIQDEKNKFKNVRKRGNLNSFVLVIAIIVVIIIILVGLKRNIFRVRPEK